MGVLKSPTKHLSVPRTFSRGNSPSPTPPTIELQNSPSTSNVLEIDSTGSKSSAELSNSLKRRYGSPEASVSPNPLRPSKKKQRKSQAQKDAEKAAELAATVNAIEEEPLFTIDVEPGAVKEEDMLPDEDEMLKIFADELGVEPLSDDEDFEDAEESEWEGKGEQLYLDEKTLKEAIQGRIASDKDARVVGRYYKEVDLTRTCGLCGETGHTSKECNHSQCFVCGEVDGDHEARNCPVAMVCSGCGGRGHFVRNCPVPRSRRILSSRCNTCSSSNHSAPNCPSLWRKYDRTGTKPASKKQKIKIIYACANDGSMGDHFIDDCPGPRGHPLKYVDASAFNEGALGLRASTKSRPRGGPGEHSSRKRKEDSRKRAAEISDDEDDFARNIRDRKDNRPKSDSRNWKNQSRTHIKFDSQNFKRNDDSDRGSYRGKNDRSYRDRDRPRERSRSRNEAGGGSLLSRLSEKQAYKGGYY